MFHVLISPNRVVYSGRVTGVLVGLFEKQCMFWFGKFLFTSNQAQISLIPKGIYGILKILCGFVQVSSKN